MTVQEVVLPLPEKLYLRLQQVAQATHQPLTDIIVRAVEMGSPPSWEEAPAQYQVDLAALNRLNDEALWQVARSQHSEANLDRHQLLLAKNANESLTDSERQELSQLRQEADRLMLRKAHAAALLRWRGHTIPPANKL